MDKNQVLSQIVNYGIKNKKKKSDIMSAMLESGQFDIATAATSLKTLGDMGVFDYEMTPEQQDQKQQKEAVEGLGTGALRQKFDALQEAKSQLKNYRNLVDQYVGDSGVKLTGKQAAELRTAKSQLLFTIATASGTGALQEADRKIVEDIIPDPTSLWSAGGNMFRGGKQGALTSIDQAMDTIDSSIKIAVGGDSQTGQNTAQASLTEQNGNDLASFNQAMQFAQQNPNDPKAQKFVEMVKTGKIDPTTGRLVETQQSEPQSQPDTTEQPAGKDDEKKGVISRLWDATKEVVPELGEDVGKRLKNIWENTWSNAEQSKDRSVFENVVRGHETLFRNLGEVAGGVGDAGARAVELAYKTAVPEQKREEIKKTATEFIKTETGQQALAALQGGVDIWEKFKEQNPNVAKDMEAAFNIITAVPSGKGLKMAAGESKALAKTATELGARALRNDATESTTKQIFKAVKPSVTVDRNKATIKDAYKSANLDLVNEGKKPTNLREYAEGLSETRKNVWSQIESKIGGGEGLTVNLKPIADELSIMGNDKNLYRVDPASAKRLKKMAETLLSDGDSISVSDAENLKQFINSELKGTFGKFNLSDAEQNAKKLITKRIGEQLDSLLSDIPGEFSDLKKRYGALRQVEDDVLKRLVVFERQNPQGLIESFSKVSGVGNIIKGIFTGSTTDIAKGAGEIVMGKIQKSANDADLIVKRAFDKLHKRHGSVKSDSWIINSMKGKGGLNLQDVSGDIYEQAKKYKSADEFVKADDILADYKKAGDESSAGASNVVDALNQHDDWVKVSVPADKVDFDRNKLFRLNLEHQNRIAKMKWDIKEGKRMRPIVVDKVYSDGKKAMYQEDAIFGLPLDGFHRLAAAREAGSKVDLYVPKSEYIKVKSQLTDIWNKANSQSGKYLYHGTTVSGDITKDPAIAKVVKDLGYRDTFQDFMRGMRVHYPELFDKYDTDKLLQIYKKSAEIMGKEMGADKSSIFIPKSNK